MLSPLLFIIVLKALSWKVKLECPEELLCAADFTLVSESVNSHKEKVEAWKQALESRRIGVDDKNRKTMISGNV